MKQEETIFVYNDEIVKIRSFTDESGEKWTLAKDLGDAIKHSNIHMNIRRIPKKWKRTKKHTLLNENAVKRILCKSRKPASIKLAKEMGIDVYNSKFECVESETLRAIKKTFKGVKMIEQFAIGNYLIDLYFPDFKIAVECDEMGHCDRNVKYEEKRQCEIESQLNCKFVRYNPHSSDFNLFTLINKIFKLFSRIDS